MVSIWVLVIAGAVLALAYGIKHFLSIVVEEEHHFFMLIGGFIGFYACAAIVLSYLVPSPAAIAGGF